MEKSIKYYLTKENLLIWEQEWKGSQSRLSERGWLKVFPQAKSVVRRLIKEFERQAKTLSLKIYNDLTAIYKLKTNNFSTWFCEEIIKVWKAEKLEKIIKTLKRLKFGLSKENKKGEITDLMIEQARHYFFENLIEFNRAKKTLCIFHNEKHPSLSLNSKTNRIKCFGCGINYDPIEYIIKTQNLSFVEAVKYLNH